MPTPADNQKPDEAATKVLHAAITPTDKGLFKLAAEDWAKANKVNDGRGVLTMWVLSVCRAAVPAHVHELYKRLKAEREQRDKISEQ